MKICLVCSSGGHFFQMYMLKEVWQGFEHFWVTFAKADTRSLLKDERVYWAYFPTNRNLKNLIRNLFLAIKILKRERPDVIISTGAGVSVPFLYAGKILGKKTIYLESLTRIKELSLSGRLVYPLVDRFLVQWPELSRRYPKALYRGEIL